MFSKFHSIIMQSNDFFASCATGGRHLECKRYGMNEDYKILFCFSDNIGIFNNFVPDFN